MNHKTKLILLAITTVVLIALGIGAVRGLSSLKAERAAAHSELADAL